MMIIVKCVEEDSEAQLEKNQPAQSMNYDHPCIFTGMSTSVAGRTQRGAKTFVARQSRPIAMVLRPIENKVRACPRR
jgi:hypothetical protein